MSSLCGICRRRATAPFQASVPQQQSRNATLIRRPKRPYTFTQLVTLSDGSTYTHRTTSPEAVFVSRKDTRNSLLWNPSSQKMHNVEADEAGKLRAFRARFGRGWDAAKPAEVETRQSSSGSSPSSISSSSSSFSHSPSSPPSSSSRSDSKTSKKSSSMSQDTNLAESGKSPKSEPATETEGTEEGEGDLLDLISDYGQNAAAMGQAAGMVEAKKRSGKGKGGEK